MLGLSRNTWFLIGGVMLVVVLYFGFSGDDGDATEDATAQSKNGKHKGKRKRDKTRGGESGGVGVGKMCAKIDCSEAQLSSFKSMVKEHRKNTSSQRRGVAEANAKVAAEFSEDVLDTAALDEAFQDAINARVEMDNSARGVLEAMHAKLSAAQREGLAKMIARHGPSALLARPTAASKKPKSKKPKSKKGRRKGGPTMRRGPGTAAALGSADGHPAPPDGNEPAALARPSRAGIVDSLEAADPAGLEAPAAAEESDALAAE